MTTRALAVRGRGLRLAEGLVLAAALVWSTFIVVAATQVSVYQSETTERFTQAEGGATSRTISHGSGTLVDENGSGILLVIAIPLFITILVAGALWIRGSRRGAGLVAWMLTGLLACFNLLAMLSIGIVIVPVTACLVVACAVRQGRALDQAR